MKQTYTTYHQRAGQSRLGAQKGEVQGSILLVSSDLNLTTSIETIFISKFCIVVAHDGCEAYKMLEEGHFTLVIAEVETPTMDGIELCQLIKSNLSTWHIPVVLLASDNNQSIMTRAFRSMADSYLVKPYSPTLVKELVNSLLFNRKKVLQHLERIEVPPTNHLTTTTDEKLIQRLVAIVEENLSNSDFLVNDLSQSVGVTAVVLNKKLKKLFGITANNFVRNIRLQRAAQLLQTGRYSVSDVTYDVGFNDLKYFRECFKQKFGTLPQHYKEHALSEEEKRSL